jgi:hypothetical protein
MTEADIVGRDQMEAAGEQRHQVAEHLAAGRQAMEQQDGRGGRVARLAVEDLATIHDRVAKMGAGRGHRSLLGGRRGWCLASPLPDLCLPKIGGRR